MHPARHAAERCHALSLASCRNNNCLILRIVFQTLNVNQRVFRYADAVQVGSRLNNVDHAPTLDNHLSSKLVRRIDNLLYPVDVGSKSGDDDSCLFMLLKQCVEYRPKLFLGRRETRPLGIRTVTHQCQYDLLSKLCKALQINRIAIYRRIIDLKVTRMHNNSCR